jgi:hypothetical protein
MEHESWRMVEVMRRVVQKMVEQENRKVEEKKSREKKRV